MFSEIHEALYFTFSTLIPVFPLLGWLSFSTSVSKHVLLNSIMVLMVQTGKASGTFQIPCLKVPTVKKAKKEKRQQNKKRSRLGSETRGRDAGAYPKNNNEAGEGYGEQIL